MDKVQNPWGASFYANYLPPLKKKIHMTLKPQMLQFSFTKGPYNSMTYNITYTSSLFVLQ
jgi:hypothetical protein